MFVSKKLKRIVAVLLVLVIALSAGSMMSVSASSTRGKIDGFSDSRSLESMYTLGQSSSPFYNSQYNSSAYEIEVVPGEEVRIPLTADMFTWSSGKNPLPMESIRVGDLTSSKVTVRTLKQKGAVALDYVQFDTDVFPGKPFHPPGALYPMTGRTACISVMFAEEFKSVKELEFRFDVYLIVNGKERSDDMKITLYGTMKNPEQEVYDLDSVNLADGSVAVSNSVNRSVKVDAGNGITIDRLMLPDKKYYATSAIKHASDSGFGKDYPDVYPGIKLVYKLNTINMRYGRSIVNINTKDDTVYFVYNEDMEYLGKSNEALLYSDMYFLSDIEIPTFNQEEYTNSIKNLPTSEVAAYETGEDNEEVYLAAEERAPLLYKSSLSADSAGAVSAVDEKPAVIEWEYFISKENGVDISGFRIKN